MNPLRRQPLSEQTAAHLADGMRQGRWGGALPGVNRLAVELHVSRETVRAALQALESEGLISSAGPGRRRTASAVPCATSAQRKLRIALLLREPVELENAETQRVLLSLQHSIEAAGHAFSFASECQVRLRDDIRRIAAVVKATEADAWVVHTATAEVLQWFASQPFPSIALGGRCVGTAIASVGTDFSPAISASVSQLARVGHRRIVMICPSYWRKPTPGRLAQLFVNELAAHGITADQYHLPDWDETPEGLHRLLESLFHLTPPTALLAYDPAQIVATFGFLSQRGIQVGRDLSLIGMFSDPVFAWRRPPLAQFRSNKDLLVKRIVRWIDAVSRGRADRELKLYPARLDPGGTIGPVRR